MCVPSEFWVGHCLAVGSMLAGTCESALERMSMDQEDPALRDEVLDFWTKVSEANERLSLFLHNRAIEDLRLRDEKQREQGERALREVPNPGPNPTCPSPQENP